VGPSRLDVQAAVRALPRAHALVLRGALSGFDEDELAALVGVPPESVRPLLRLAAAKLSGLLAEPGRDGGGPP
jgi:DNA-directed RNA polymerase specialized sigma24 family protein